MNRAAVDTSVLIAAMQSWHTEHERCRTAVGRLLEVPPVIVALHVLLETYSVLTRVPKPLRLAPKHAFAQLDQTLRGKVEVARFDEDAAFDLLRGFRNRAVTGGAVYDALIAEVVFRAGARSLLTLNRQHFERLAPEGLEILEP